MTTIRETLQNAGYIVISAHQLHDGEQGWGLYTDRLFVGPVDDISGFSAVLVHPEHAGQVADNDLFDIDDRPTDNMIERMKADPDLIARDLDGDYWRWNPETEGFQFMPDYDLSHWINDGLDHHKFYLSDGNEAEWASLYEMHMIEQSQK